MLKTLFGEEGRIKYNTPFLFKDGRWCIEIKKKKTHFHQLQMFVNALLSSGAVLGRAGQPNRHSQPRDEEEFWRSAGWSHQQTDAADQRQAAAP